MTNLHIMRKHILHFLLIIALLPVSLLTINSANAQFALGGGLELREEEPKTGINLRLEKELEFSLPFVKFRGRVQGGFFTNDGIELSQNQLNQFSDPEINSYYAGANLLAEIGIPIPINPYGGLGVGYETITVKAGDATGNQSGNILDDSEGSGYIEATVGLKLSLLPLFKPFVEYRSVEPFSDLDQFRNNVTSLNRDATANNRFVFGILLQF